eukprot:CAMPEP_0175084698 /NCGR_PEP_ID=MMETSP0052_2-20121109/28218_1 /TAXON_ID=51329 ORGANISM="Polytomella parva, Strain SAG 63-3" /NCGR_SAMPLE_ID=MMETSP0052_2 /ASSEMBLY_ACC=CAM_ASM_000194 /LENGTH=121 /DNA_ID=CAMNT_0016356559 /DNA_START=271 /DNA_END=635 /DNA_ORIENTATION=-
MMIHRITNSIADVDFDVRRVRGGSVIMVSVCTGISIQAALDSAPRRVEEMRCQLQKKMQGPEEVEHREGVGGAGFRRASEEQGMTHDADPQKLFGGLRHLGLSLQRYREGAPGAHGLSSVF